MKGDMAIWCMCVCISVKIGYAMCIHIEVMHLFNIGHFQSAFCFTNWQQLINCPLALDQSFHKILCNAGTSPSRRVHGFEVNFCSGQRTELHPSPDAMGPITTFPL